MSTNELLVKEVELSKTARSAMRMQNDGGNPEVLTLKLLSAALITQLEKIGGRNGGNAGREAAVAITQVQTASFWAVHAATKPVPTTAEAADAEKAAAKTPPVP